MEMKCIKCGKHKAKYHDGKCWLCAHAEQATLRIWGNMPEMLENKMTEPTIDELVNLLERARSAAGRMKADDTEGSGGLTSDLGRMIERLRLVQSGWKEDTDEDRPS